MVSIEDPVPFFYRDDMPTSAFVSSDPCLHGFKIAGLFFCRRARSIKEAGDTLFLFLLPIL